MCHPAAEGGMHNGDAALLTQRIEQVEHFRGGDVVPMFLQEILHGLESYRMG